MWLRKFQQYKLNREMNRAVAALHTAPPLELPKKYLQCVKRYPYTAIDRQQRVHTAIQNMDEVVNWILETVDDLEQVTRTSKLAPPGTTGTARDVRLDSVLYMPSCRLYVSTQQVFERVIAAYAILAEIVADKTHASHYRAKDRVMPHIENLHKFFIKII